MLKIIASTLNYHNFFYSLWWCPFGGAGTVWKCIFFLLLQVNSRSSKEEILHLLAKKGDQVSKLEAKIAGEQIFKNSFKWTHPVCRFIKYYTHVVDQCDQGKQQTLWLYDLSSCTCSVALLFLFYLFF